jgi:hypothetical protein
MDFHKKDLWLTLAVLAAGAIIALIGGIIGKTVLGWILLAVGLVLAAVVVYLRFKVFKELFAVKRLWTLIGGGGVAALVVAAIVIMLVSSASPQTARPIAGGTPPDMMGTPGAVLPSVAATETEVPTTATFAPTATAEPTVTATPVGPIFVCLNENTTVGYSMRVAPSKDAAFGGQLQWGSCFTVDGKAAGVTGWYHVTPGQEGNTIGLEIDVDETKVQLWVDGYYLESFGVDLETLPEIIVNK